MGGGVNFPWQGEILFSQVSKYMLFLALPQLSYVCVCVETLNGSADEPNFCNAYRDNLTRFRLWVDSASNVSTVQAPDLDHFTSSFDYVNGN